ncbi:VOC family protein [Furfurilactobacillus entadae]|uniref:hypothetical protein n=1 Tax=Furfurilactobacillus entadae TaxID=2922307 RepID=UPI0035E5CFEE
MPSITHIQIMLYVNDVPAMATFWQHAVSAEVSNRQNMPDESESVTLTILNQVDLCLFDQHFIQTTSPEVALNSPSLLFQTSHFDVLYHQIRTVSPSTGAISVHNQQRSFNFADPEGHYFAVSEIPS